MRGALVVFRASRLGREQSFDHVGREPRLSHKDMPHHSRREVVGRDAVVRPPSDPADTLDDPGQLALAADPLIKAMVALAAAKAINFTHKRSSWRGCASTSKVTLFKIVSIALRVKTQVIQK